MKILDLFCGLKSWSNIWEKNGHDVETLDILSEFNPTYCCDILDWEPQHDYDVIYASPPCTYFSFARCRWKNTPIATTKEQISLSIKLAQKGFDIIDKNCKGWYVVENPYWAHGMWSYFKDRNDHHIIDYCRYNYEYKKPTSIWSNVDIDYKRCIHKNHKSFQNTSGSIKRSIIPEQLSLDIYNKIMEK